MLNYEKLSWGQAWDKDVHNLHFYSILYYDC